MANLYIVATPIGNLEDITLRALEVLKKVDLILCEDTRVTKKLLDRYQIKKPLLSYHQHSKLQKIDYIISLLKEGKPSTRAKLGAGLAPHRNEVSGAGNLALVSDAGTPGISDPGGKLVNEVVKSLSGLVKIVPIPGPSAVIAAASISGFPMDKFLFFGFLPKKKKRKKILKEIANFKYPVIFYESPYRILKTLEELKKLNGELKIVVAKELTKKFETIYRGSTGEVIEKIGKDKIKGEFIVIVGK
jgi:16S rRNA (cytidine1402-2'-O)-methyltransferase